MPTNRLYSFRYPIDVASTLEPWRKVLDDSDLLTGAGDFDSVVARLSDRDRALEDHVNLGVSQGRLAYAVSNDGTSRSTQGTTDMAGLSVTVTVPANRVLRVSGQAILSTLNDGAGGSPPVVAGRIYADGASIGFFGFISLLDTAATGTLYHETFQSSSIIVTPAAGTHTYKLVAEMVTADVGQVVVGGSPDTQASILVEDIGPVNT